MGAVVKETWTEEAASEMKKELPNALLLQVEHDLRSAEVEEREEGEGEGVEEKEDEWKCDFCHVGFASYQHASDHEANCEHQMLDHGAPVEIPGAEISARASRGECRQNGAFGEPR